MAATYYFIKLYYDLLDDYKVGSLPEPLKWRFIQCLLVAGEHRKGGVLPRLEEMAYRLRPMSPDALNNDLEQLAAAGLVELKKDKTGKERWFVTNFSKRQESKSNAERQRAWRARQAKEETQPKRLRNEPVTSRYLDIDIDNIHTYTHTTPPPYDGHTENNNQPIDELKNALAATVKQILGPGVNEQLFDDAAYTLFGYDVTPQQVRDFGTWWEANGYYSGKPAIKSLLTDIRNSVNGVSAKPKQKPIKNDKQEKKAILLKQVGKSWKDAEPVLVEAGLIDTVKKMGRWEDLGRMQPTDITIKFFTAYGVTHGR
jgi:hypothetical protein